MKNLELFEISRFVPNETYENVSHIAYADNLVYALKNLQLLVYDSSGTVLHTFSPTFNCITQFEILDIEKRLWFGTGTQFVFVNITDNSLQIIEQSCAFDAAAWNPAQDSIAVVTSSGEVGVYTVDFEGGCLLPLQKSHLNNQLVNEFVAVGWGSEDTQFRGSSGKAKATVVEQEEPALTDDDQKPRICWRGNGEMFAINYYNNGKRKFKVFQYPCELIHESPDIIGLLPVIAWRPQGNRIACVVWTNKRCELTLCEKNGFLKNTFELIRKERVEELKWSPCGEVLAVRQSSPDKCITVDLYIMKNYVWYLKQRLNFTDLLIGFEFLHSPCMMIVVRSTTKYETVTYSFKYTLHSSLSINSNESAITCLSVNGQNVYLTHCEYGVMPPPLCDSVTVADAPVNFVIFHPEKSRLALIDSTNKITVYDVVEKQLKVLGQYHLNHKTNYNIPLMFHHFVWYRDRKIMCLGEIANGDESLTNKFILNIQDDDCSNWNFNIDDPVMSGINYMDVEKDSGGIVQQSLNEITLTTDDGILEFLSVLPTFALFVKLFKINNKMFVFSLTSTSRFYVDETEVLQGVISFIIHGKYLFLTTTQNTMLGVRLNELALEDLCHLKLSKIYSRPVEPGSYLLFGIPQTSSVAMQIPRGNIETCTCQIISIDRLEGLIQQNAWDKAVDLVRVEKLVTSTIVDLDVNRFLNSIDKFVQIVETPAILSDFLLGLQKENVFQTIYRTCGITATVETERKCELVCDRMIEYMEQNNYSYYISCIIVACFIKNSPNSVREALHHVRNLLHLAEKDPSAIKVAEEALKSVYILKPNSELYQTALAMYDLNLALFVARNINMDPKEYEPFIYNLKSLDEVLCRFKINDFLKQHGKAVRYLVRCAENSSEVVKYMEEYGVYKEAYESVQPKCELCIEVTNIYAQHLSKQSLYEEAAILLQRAALYEEALKNYIKANRWKEAISIMQRLNLPQMTSNQHLHDIINGLIKVNRIVEASNIYHQYLVDYESAIALLIKYNLFTEAVELAIKYNRADIYESDIYVGVLEYCRSLCSKLEDMDTTFIKYKTRLNEVRTEKRAKVEACVGHDTYFHSAPNFEDDMLSIAGTNASTVSIRTSGSRSSTMSSRNRRKEERKKQDLRHGGFYEDIALMRALYDLIHEVFELGPQVRELCIVGLNMDANIINEIKLLHSSLLKLQTLIQNSTKTIWPPHLNSPEQSEDPHAKMIHENINSLDVKYRAPPTNLNTSWALTVLSTT